MKVFLLFLPVFLSSFLYAQNVGIGTSAPYSQLTFSNSTGQKISLYGTAVNNYGFGVVGGTLQIHSDAQGSDIAFGYGNSGAFTQIMRMKGNGNVGIGTNPTYLLDLNGRMRIRNSGGSSGTAGLWLNNTSNVEKVFIGMEDDAHVGFYSSAPGWMLTINSETGALKVNGTEGTEKQVLSSTGNSSSWKTLGALIQSYYKYPPNMWHVEGYFSSSTPDLVLPAITHIITVTTKSRLIISASIIGDISCPFGCGGGSAVIDISINGNEIVAGIGGVAEIFVPANSSGIATISNFFYDVNPGTYTVDFITQSSQGTGLRMISKYSTILVLPID